MIKTFLAGRLTLLKSVLSSIPLYYLSFFPAPKKVIRKITRLQHNFLWGGKGNANKVAWIKWKKVCNEKEKGGLGIRGVEVFNKALLSK